MNIEKEKINNIAKEYGTPLYIYSKKLIWDFLWQAKLLWNYVPLQIRYAMKANSNEEILKYYLQNDVWIDASSSYEVEKVLALWFEWYKIQLSSQQRPHDYNLIKDNWVFYVACSLNQIESRWKLYPNTSIWVRINPWIWSSLNSNKTNVWWPNSSFGIWHEYINQINEIANRYNLKISKIHTHIWSWTDPDVWHDVAQRSFDLLYDFPDADTIDLWWWFKIARVDWEKTCKFTDIWEKIKTVYDNFEKNTSRKINVEIEPWTFLVANAWFILTKVEDIVDTWANWHKFIKCDTGMNDIIRPSMYWSQHPIDIINNSSDFENYVIVWHCCESGDILTPAAWDPESIATRSLPKANIWDLLIIWWCGAYCASMSTKWYNSYPLTPEIFID